MQGATELALTKLDVLGYLERIPVCTHYDLDGVRTDEFPFPTALAEAKPVIEYVDGWHCDLSGVRTWEALPAAAKAYVERIEAAVGCRIGYVSVGAEREAYVRR